MVTEPFNPRSRVHPDRARLAVASAAP